MLFRGCPGASRRDPRWRRWLPSDRTGPAPSHSLPDRPDAVAVADQDAIRRVLAQASRTRNYDAAELREAVSQFAADARSAEVPPERVLIAVKQLVDEHSPGGVSDWWRSVVTDRVVRWAVEGYYRIDLGAGDASGGSPP